MNHLDLPITKDHPAERLRRDFLAHLKRAKRKADSELRGLIAESREFVSKCSHEQLAQFIAEFGAGFGYESGVGSMEFGWGAA